MYLCENVHTIFGKKNQQSLLCCFSSVTKDFIDPCQLLVSHKIFGVCVHTKKCEAFLYGLEQHGVLLCRVLLQKICYIQISF